MLDLTAQVVGPRLGLVGRMNFSLKILTQTLLKKGGKSVIGYGKALITETEISGQFRLDRLLLAPQHVSSIPVCEWVPNTPFEPSDTIPRDNILEKSTLLRP